MSELALSAALNPVGRRVNLRQIAREPFRIFFPLAVLSGMSGVALWPLHLWGILPTYPGQIHARVMAYGLFGGFILGFLGTAMPRMLSANPLRLPEAFGLAALYLAMVISFLLGHTAVGDILLVLLLAGFAGVIVPRALNRKDIPPPGFVLVGLALLCVVSGAILAVAQNRYELDLFWINLQRLLSYQGFVLLPILGIGPFILPRFFGHESTHDFPEMLVPGKNWTLKALFAGAVGLTIIGSFVLEAAGWLRTAYGIRFAVVVIYAWRELPLHRAPKARSALGAALRVAFISLAGGFLAICLFPVFRVGLLHLTLIGGFTVITFLVATRVVYGHSGNIHLLKSRNRWIWISVGLMLFGMATRISGDFWPKIMASHYAYGAILWIVSAAIWSIYVLPKVLVCDPED